MLPHIKRYGCSISSHHTPIPSAQYGAVIAKDSPLQSLISQAILELNDEGILNELKDKWFWNACESDEDTTKISRFDLTFFSSLFSVLIAGMMFSSILLACEQFVMRISLFCTKKNSHHIYEQVRLIRITRKDSFTRQNYDNTEDNYGDKRLRDTRKEDIYENTEEFGEKCIRDVFHSRDFATRETEPVHV